MFLTRHPLDYTEIYQHGLFSDVEITVNFESETRCFHLHKAILCASSLFFKNALTTNGKVDQTQDKMSLDMKISLFEAFIKLVYEGFVNLDQDMLPDFEVALNNLGVLCVPEFMGMKKIKTEADGSDIKPRMTFESSINALSEENVRKLIRNEAGQKKFHCSLCDKVYQNRTGAFDHIMSVHRTVKNYNCFYCEESFATSHIRSWHISKNHASIHKVQKVHLEALEK